MVGLGDRQLKNAMLGGEGEISLVEEGIDDGSKFGRLVPECHELVQAAHDRLLVRGVEVLG